jgi:pyruvate dehydrogenase E2 component (dihydrolipoamide acetyltransferase)
MRELGEYLALRKPVIRRFHPRYCVPTVTIDTLVTLDAALAWKRRLEALPEAADVRPTLNTILLKATAMALRGHMLFNHDHDGRGRVIPNPRIDLRSPLDMEDFPMHIVVPDTDHKTVFQIAKEYRERAERARAFMNRRLNLYLGFHRLPLLPRITGAMADLTRWLRPRFPGWERRFLQWQHQAIGTFMVTNMGTLGISACRGQLVRPSISALLVMAARDEVRAEAGRPVARKVLPLGLEFDPRVADDAAAARFLADIRRNLEDPEKHCGHC